MRPPQPVTATERADAVRSLRTIGGVYNHIATIVEHDHTTPNTATADPQCDQIGHIVILNVCVRCGLTVIAHTSDTPPR